MIRRAGLIAGFVLTATVAFAQPASAHPLGNFTVNVYAGLVVHQDELTIDYVVDMAEIPAFQERAQIDANGDGNLDQSELATYRQSRCDQLTQALHSGRPGPIVVRSASLRFVRGAAGLPTERLECELASDLGSATSLQWSDGNFAGRAGWHEITAIGDRTTLSASDVPSSSASARLTAYPRDLLRSPLDQRTASLHWRLGGPEAATTTAANTGPPSVSSGDTVSGVPFAADAATRWYTSLIGGHSFGLLFALLAVLLSIVLGGAHGLAPGHGKTVMAAYLIGQRSRMRDAMTMGLSVAITHTAGVVALGLALTVSTAYAPERLYPWLSLASGVMILAVAVNLARTQRRLRRHQNEHNRSHEHDHGHSHDHPHRPSRRSLIALGFVGGMVPSPSALVVLLGALALHRAWFGVLLVLGYGVGMAVVLVAAGMLLVRGGDVVARIGALRRPALARVAAAIPVLSVATVAGAGLLVVARSAVSV
jgi:nickel/cobalt exporter